MATDTFTLTATYHKPDGTPEKQLVPVKVLLAGVDRVRDVTGKILILGGAAAPIVDGTFVCENLPDPRDPTLNPTGFGYKVSVRLNDTHFFVSFGPAELDAHLIDGVLNLNDVTPVEEVSLSPSATYVDHATYTTEIAALLAIIAELQDRMEDLETQAALPFVEDPPGSGLYTIVGLTEDPDEPGLYSVLGLTEDLAAPGLYLIGA